MGGAKRGKTKKRTTFVVGFFGAGNDSPARQTRPVASFALGTGSRRLWGAASLRRSNPDANHAGGSLFPLKKIHRIRG